MNNSKHSSLTSSVNNPKPFGLSLSITQDKPPSPWHKAQVSSGRQSNRAVRLDDWRWQIGFCIVTLQTQSTFVLQWPTHKTTTRPPPTPPKKILMSPLTGQCCCLTAGTIICRRTYFPGNMEGYCFYIYTHIIDIFSSLLYWFKAVTQC